MLFETPTLQLVTIIILGLSALIALGAVLRGRGYAIGFFILFGAYAYHDLTLMYAWKSPDGIFPILLLVAAATALISTCGVYARG